MLVSRNYYNKIKEKTIAKLQIINYCNEFIVRTNIINKYGKISLIELYFY
jgi:hypothetical protein